MYRTNAVHHIAVTVQSRCRSPSTLSNHLYKRLGSYKATHSSSFTAHSELQTHKGVSESLVPYTERKTRRRTRDASQTYDSAGKLPTVNGMLPLNLLPPRFKYLQTRTERESKHTHSSITSMSCPRGLRWKYTQYHVASHMGQLTFRAVFG